MSKSVEVVVRSVYGQERIYPGNENAQIFARIVGSKTLSRSVLNMIRELGYEVHQVSEGVKL